MQATSEGGSGPDRCVYDLQVPGGAEIAIWVGARTSTTNDTGDTGTWSTETNTKGSPTGDDNWSNLGQGTLGSSSFTDEDAGTPAS